MNKFFLKAFPVSANAKITQVEKFVKV